LHRAGNIDEPAWLIRLDRYRCDMILGHRRTQQVDSMTVPLARDAQSGIPLAYAD
jgi:hypothetical protein